MSRHVIVRRSTRVRLGLVLLLGAGIATPAPMPSAESCVRSQGYWKTHPGAWPVRSLILGRPSVAHTYSQPELLTILHTSTRGDASVSLAYQLIAAKLNVASGANPSPVAGALAQADALLGDFPGRLPYRVPPSSSRGASMVAVGRVLDDYNNGRIDGSCGPANRAPVADAGDDQTGPVGQRVALDGSGSSDPDGDVLTYAWTFVVKPAASLAVLSDASIVNPTFAIDVPGRYELALVVSDSGRSSAPDTVVISTVNSAPVARAGADTTARVGETVTLDGGGSFDVDGDQLSFSWTLISKPDGSLAAFADSGAVSPTFTIDRSGDYVARLVVNDGHVPSDPDTVVITTINSRPVAHAGPDQTIFVGVEARLDGSASSDVDGNPLEYRWSLISKPTGSAAALSNLVAVMPTFAADVTGTYVVQLIVNDGTADSEPDLVTLTTENRPPIAQAGGDQTVAVNSDAHLDGAASSDPDNDTLTFAWTLLFKPAGSDATLSGADTPTPTFAPDVPGEYVAQLIVRDGVFASEPDTVTVSTRNSKPSADAGPDQTVATGATVTLDGSGSSDPDGTALEFAWALLSSPSGSTASIVDPAAPHPTFVADVDGLYVVQLIVGDGSLMSDPDTVAIHAATNAVDLSIAFEHPPTGTLPPGAEVTFAVRAANLGSATASEVNAVMALPAGFSLTSSLPSRGAYDAASGVWTIGTLDASAEALLVIAVTVNATGPMALNATIASSAQTDPNPGNNSASAAAANRPPVATAGTDVTVRQGILATVDGSGSSDPDGDTLSFAWTLSTKPFGSSASLNGSDTPSPSFSADRSGDFVLDLVVADGHGGLASDTVVVTAVANQAPLITSSPPTTGRVGDAYGYLVIAADADTGDQLTFSLPIAPAGMSIDPLTGAVQWTPSGAQTGANHVVVHVRDRASALVAQSFSVTVANGASNGAPIAEDDHYDARTGESLSVPAPGVLGNDLDPDNNRLSARALTQPKSGNVIVDGDGSFTYTPFTFREGELVLADNVNLTSLTGVTATASTSLVYRTTVGGPESAIDGSPGTSWLTQLADSANMGPHSRTGAAPFIEVTFPTNVTVRELAAIGHRDPLLSSARIVAGNFQLFDVDGAEIFESGNLDLSLPDADVKVTVPALITRSRNVARTAAGVIYRASSSQDGQEPARAFDGDLFTRWGSGFGLPTPQFLEVEFPSAIDVHRVKIFGSRISTTQDFLTFAVQVFDANAALIFDSGPVSATAATSDLVIVVGGVSGARRLRVIGTQLENVGSSGGIAELEVISTETVAAPLNDRVRRARFTATADGGLQAGLAEFKALGSALVQRARQIEPNLTYLLPTTVRASSFIPTFNSPEHAVDDTPARSWYAATSNPGEFLELEFPVDVSVNELRTTNPTSTPGGFQTSLTIDCSGVFTLIAADGTVLFDSGIVNQPAGSVGVSPAFSLPVGDVSGVRRLRWTSTGCGPTSSFSPGFSEVKVLGSAAVDAAPIVVTTKLHALVGREVHSTPLVANLTDDNGDGLIDRRDVPDIVVAVEAIDDQLTGEIKVVSGDDGRELVTMGTPNSISPWAEPAVGDIDEDGTPDVVAIHTDGSHLIAFEASGEVKWLSDSWPVPQFALGSGVDVGAVTIANLDAAGRPEVIVGAAVFSAEGRLIGDGASLGGTTGGAGLRSRMPAVADIDLDGVPELVAGPTAYRLSGGALQIVWQRGDRADGYVGIANLDDDPAAEIVVVADGSVYVLSHDGSDAAFWNPPSAAPVPIPGGGQGGAPTIADVDGDGIPEIGVAGARYYTVFNRDGSVRWKAVVSDFTSNATGSTVFDLDGDGSLEIVYRDEANLRIYRGSDGVLLAKLALGSSTWSEMPVVADVDNDGHADIVVAADNFILNGPAQTGVHVLHDIANRWVRTRRIWNQHAYHVTNVNEDGAIPLAESPHFTIPELNAFRLNAFVPDGGDDSSDRFTYVSSDGDKQSAPATVHVAVRKPNSAPRFTSTGVSDAAVNVPYVYVPRVTDPDHGDVLAFSLPTSPGGMTIDPASGLIRWLPSNAQRGAHEVVVKVRDARGLFALQGYSVLVDDAVSVPDVVGRPRTTAATTIAAAQLSAGSVTPRHSPTVPIDAVVSQSPAAGTLVAARSAVDLFVSLGPAPLGTVPDLVGMQQSTAQADIIAAGFALGAIGGEHRASAPAGIVLSQNPAAGSAASSGSSIDLLVSLGIPPSDRDSDGDGFTGAAGDCDDTSAAIGPGASDVPGDGIDQNCNGRDSVAGDAVAPVSRILSPGDGDAITQRVDITGVATDDNFLRYRLEFGGVDAITLPVLRTGTAPVVDSVLGTIDPTLLENGLYRARLTVEDSNGHTAVDERVYRVTGDAKVGVLALSFVDVEVPVASIPVAVIRSYDSRVKEARDFGVGWSLDVRTGTYQHNRAPGRGWIINDQPFLGSFLPCVGGVTETRSHFTEVRLSQRESYLFALRVTGGSLGITGACEGTAAFRFIDGTIPGATLDILDGTDVIYLRGGDDTVLDMNAFLSGDSVVYNPRRVRLTTPDGRRVEFDRVDGITRIQDRHDNTLTIGAGGIVHSSGKSIAFTRDASGRIASITDPAGRVLSYAYDSNGDLSSVTDQAGGRTSFTYDHRHNLLELRDPLGRAARREYDAAGRLIALIDAEGNRTTLEHDIDDRREVLTNRLGETTVLEYDERGNIVRVTDALGKITSYTFDGRDNLLSETDPLGHRRTLTYDAHDNVLTETDAVGQTTSFTYNALNQILTRTDARGGTTRFTYDSKGSLVEKTDPTGAKTSFTYDDRGNRSSVTDPVGAVFRYAYDTAGNVIEKTDPLGNVVQLARNANGKAVSETRSRMVAGALELATSSFEYDELNRRTVYRNAVGAETRLTYTATGQVATRTDARGGTRRFKYDAEDRLIESINAEGMSERVVHDAEGRPLSVTDAAERTTRFTYDAAGRMVSRTFADGASTHIIYDAAGRVASEIDERGNSVEFIYDAAGRLTSTRDALGGFTLMTYDTVGNIRTITDRNGNTATYEYDGDDRLVRTTFPDGTSASEAYDAFGRRISYTDPAGNVTRYEYDPRGALTRVVDALGHATEYEFDEYRSRVGQTDALGHTTRFVHDSVGRRVATILPLGQTETRTYDVIGNLISVTDFNGASIDYEYDVMNRLRRRVSTGGAEHTFTYTPTGEIAAFSDEHGTTLFSYDERSRPSLVRVPGGDDIRYSYDPAGNRTAVTTPAGTISYGYDAASRLVGVTDLDGHRSTFRYDANGNLLSADLANGTVANYEYDSLNRLIDVTHRRGATTLASFRYSVGPVGNRTRVLEDSGRTIDYDYDALFRLVEERVTTPGEPTRAHTYSYDAAGNRTSETGPGGTIAYTYDANNRLLRAGTAAFTYDANGNLRMRTDAGGTTTHLYDALNRLIRTTSPAGDTNYRYDAMGHRVLKADSGGETRYLIDPFSVSELSEVLRETSAAGPVDYVRAGKRVLSARRSGGSSYYLQDGGMSTRMLTDAAGTVTDSYDYGAFGNIVSRSGSSPNPFLFGGQPLDSDTGLYHLRARYYAPDVGRFTSRDPFPGVIVDPGSLHAYTYAHSDPVNRTDPSGRFTLVEQMTIAGAVGIYASMGYAAQNYYYYRSADLAFEVGVDAFWSHASLAMDMLGLGALVRQMGVAIVGAVRSAVGGKAVQKTLQIGKSAERRVEEVIEVALCRKNAKWNCGGLKVPGFAETKQALEQAQGAIPKLTPAELQAALDAAKASAEKTAAKAASAIKRTDVTPEELAEVTVVAQKDYITRFFRMIFK